MLNTEIHQFHDDTTGITAILCYSGNMDLPAIGGCRWHSYPTYSAAVEDAKCLANSMRLKAVTHKLPLAGAKCVCHVPKPVSLIQRQDFFQRLGQFIESQQGRYITATDSGTLESDMDAIHQSTAYVCNHSHFGSPSPHTAQGVYETIAALQEKVLCQPLSSCTAALQGTGSVGMNIAINLSQRIAQVYAADTNTTLQLQKLSRLQWLNPDEIYTPKTDFFIPCALSHSIQPRHLNNLRHTIIAGAANCPIAPGITQADLSEHHIQAVPDYVINAGGLIYCAAQFYKKPEWMGKIKKIPEKSFNYINI